MLAVYPRVFSCLCDFVYLFAHALIGKRLELLTLRRYNLWQDVDILIMRSKVSS